MDPMNLRVRSFYFVVPILIVINLSISACTAPVVSQLIMPGETAFENPGTVGVNSDRISNQSGSNNVPAGMITFNGSVFVAISELNRNVWRQAGWLISDQLIDTDTQEVPEDCTLYGHKGVEGQWVGRCRGRVLIPKDGAKHIAVMHTSQDGNTTLIQVAPPP